MKMKGETMPVERPPLEPLRTSFQFNLLDDEQLDLLQEATLTILEETGVQFPSEQALAIFAEHGAMVDMHKQIVRLPRQLVLDAMAQAPRNYTLGARLPDFDLPLRQGVTYFTTDGCGHETIDFYSGQRRASCKADVAMTARIIDRLSSVAFYWPMVSAQDYGKTAPLHELDAAWNHTVKHVQSETLMGAVECRHAVEMATVICGDRESIRQRPPFSLTLCTIAPLMQDKEGIEGALVLAEAGIPVGFLAMPTLGTTAPATLAGAFAMADAEVISAAVLLQLAYPGAPVFHSIMHAWADPRSAAYVGYPLDTRARYAPVEMAHHWGIPAFGGAFGTHSDQVDSWQAAAEVALDPFLIGLSGAEFVTGIGLRNIYTLLVLEAILLDDDLYHRARYALMDLDVSPETLAVEVVNTVGPGGHFLSQKHTRRHMRTAMQRAITQQLDENGKYRMPLEVAHERIAWILENHHPEPLEPAQQSELKRILDAAGRELS
jgi:trimethylamine---corrinoid protein Co-methyltransferase